MYTIVLFDRTKANISVSKILKKQNAVAFFVEVTADGKSQKQIIGITNGKSKIGVAGNKLIPLMMKVIDTPNGFTEAASLSSNGSESWLRTKGYLPPQVS